MKLQRVVLKEYPKGELQAEHMAIIEEAIPELAEGSSAASSRAFIDRCVYSNDL